MPQICPKCKSQNISPDASLSSLTSGTWTNHWKCNACGYNGIFFPDVDEELIKKI